MEKTQIEATKTSPLERGFTITVPVNELEACFAKHLAAMRPKVKIKGFRPGRAPDAQIRMRHGTDLMNDAVQEILDQQTRALIEEHSLKPAEAPRATLKTPIEELLKGGVDLVCEIEMPLIPEFTLAALEEVQIDRLVAPLEEKDVDEALAAMAKSQKRFSSEASDTALASGDMAVMDLRIQRDGRLLSGGRENNFRVILGEGRLPHEFEAALLGHKAGEAVEAEVSFPQNHPTPELAGQKAVFSADLRAVHKPRPAPDNAELAEASGCKNVEELKERLRTRMEASDKQMQRMHAHAAIYEALARLHRFDVPESVITRMAAMFEQQGTEKAAAKTRAQERLRLQFIFSEISRKYDLKVETPELRTALMTAIEQQTSDEGRKQAEEFYKTRQGQQALYDSVLEEKLLDFVAEKASATLKKVTREALYTPPKQ